MEEQVRGEGPEPQGAKYRRESPDAGPPAAVEQAVRTKLADKTEAIYRELMAMAKEARLTHDFQSANIAYANAFNMGVQCRSLEIDAVQKSRERNYHRPYGGQEEEF